MGENGDRNLIELPVPEGAKYGGYPVTEFAYDSERDHLHIVYEWEDLPQGRDQIVFENCERRDGTPVVKSSKNTDDYPSDLVFPEEAREGDTPGRTSPRGCTPRWRRPGSRWPGGDRRDPSPRRR